MPVRPRIQLRGYKELRKDLRRFGDEAVDMLKQANKEAADLVAGTARPNVPVRSGALLTTLRTSGTTRGGVVRAGRRSVPYAGPVHFGWPSRPNRAKGWRGGPIAPNPFLYDAVDKRRDDVIKVYERFLMNNGPLHQLEQRAGRRIFPKA